jgi:hypothetical protein
VSENHDIRAAGDIVLESEWLTEDRPHAKDGEVLPGDGCRAHELRAIAVREVQRTKPGVRAQRLDAAHVLTVEEITPAVLAQADLVSIPSDELHEPLGLGIRQWTQQDGVDDAEDGRVGADPERQRQQRRGGEAGSPGQRADRVPQVLHQVLAHHPLSS